MNKFTYVGGFLAIMLLVGAGCSSASPSSETEKPPNEPSPIVELEQRGAAETSSPNADLPSEVASLSLEVEQIEGDAVTFSWQIPDSVTDVEQFRLVRGEEANPVYDGLLYWVQAHGTKRDIVWEEFPEGEWHVRLCTFDVEEEECGEYSNDVTVLVE